MAQRGLSVGTVLAMVLLLLAAQAYGNYVVEYQEDFTSDPGWTTDQPANYYWDSGTGTYHATTENAPPGAPAPPPPPPTRYAYTPVNYDGNSMKLTFDMQPTDTQWSAAVQFGLYNHVLAGWEQDPETAGARGVYVQLGRADGGIFLTLYVIDSNGIAQYDQVYNVYSDGTWFHFEMEYQCSIDEVVLVMTERDTGAPVATLQAAGFGGLPNTLDYLGFSRDPAGWNCPSAGGYSCTNEATAYLDNVEFSEIANACDDGVVRLEIKPGSCPNPLNPSSHGVLPVAVVGTADFDVTMIDVSSARLSRADGVGGEVTPTEGPPGPHSVFEDVASPFEGEPCDCHDLLGEGIDDLSMKFVTDDVVEALQLNELSPGDEVELIVTGLMVDGSPFTTTADCIRIVAGDPDDGEETNEDEETDEGTDGVDIDIGEIDILAEVCANGACGAGGAMMMPLLLLSLRRMSRRRRRATVERP